MASTTLKDYFKGLALPSDDDASRTSVYDLFLKIVANERWSDYDGNDEFQHIELLKAMSQHVPSSHSSACTGVVDLLSCVGDLSTARAAVEKLGDSAHEAAASSGCEVALTSLDRQAQRCKALLNKKLKGFEHITESSKTAFDNTKHYLQE
eukprot:8874344-Pyramimonas_sp.AAC.1